MAGRAGLGVGRPGRAGPSGRGPAGRARGRGRPLRRPGPGPCRPAGRPGDRERGGRGRGPGRPPASASGGLAAARRRPRAGRQRPRRVVREVRAAGAAGLAAGRPPPDRVHLHGGGRLAVGRRVRAAAHPDRAAALAALAVVGRGSRGRPGGRGADDGRPARPAGARVPRQPLAVPALARVVAAPGVAAIAVVLVSLLVGAGSLVGRFGRARGTERQQLRWLALAAVLAAGLLLVGLVAGYLGRDAVVFTSLTLCVALLPLATGAAILRYRLYDLDRIISRTVAYGLLTVLLGGGYAAVVLGLGRLVGRDSSLAVAAATLAVAAVFQPARRRIQALVDRRFNRRHYDTSQTVAAFSARLREQLDLDTLSAEVLAVAEQTMQPTRASLWLRPPPA